MFGLGQNHAFPATCTLSLIHIYGKLIQWFEVEGTLLYTTTELVNGALHWEIVSGSSSPVSTTGSQKVGEEDIPPVKTYPVGAMQRAVLKRG